MATLNCFRTASSQTFLLLLFSKDLRNYIGVFKNNWGIWVWIWSCIMRMLFGSQLLACFLGTFLTIQVKQKLLKVSFFLCGASDWFCEIIWGGPQRSRHYVITQVVPKLLKGYSRGNHKPIFGLQVLAHLQSERALSWWFSFVDDDFKLVIGFNGFCLCLDGVWMEGGFFQAERHA